MYHEPLPSVDWWGPQPPRAYVEQGRGPERVDSGEQDPKFTRRPVGFLADLEVEKDPQVWEGDSA